MTTKLEKAWAIYIEICVNPEAGESQRIETKKAFLAGNINMWNRINSIKGVDDAYTEEQLDEIESDFDKVIRDIDAGRL